MASKNFELSSFFKKIESHLKDRSSGLIDDALLKEVVPKSGECFFVFDLTKNLIVHFGGLKNMFGYDFEKINLTFLFDILHPNDSHLVQAIIKNSIDQIIQAEIPKYTNVFKLSSRIRKSNGEYIKILSDNFILQTNKNNLVQSILVRYTDISFLDESEEVDWWVDTEFIDKEAIVNSVYGERKDVFTRREKEIVLLIILGSSNAGISRDLSISHHTVATHRKNILSKSKCSGVQDLKTYCKKNGVFAVS
jgi:DNA-binding CsgD family transcriptional regulator